MLEISDFSLTKYFSVMFKMWEVGKMVSENHKTFREIHFLNFLN